jgi:hypothetical protein
MTGRNWLLPGVAGCGRVLEGAGGRGWVQGGCRRVLEGLAGCNGCRHIVTRVGHQISNMMTYLGMMGCDRVHRTSKA